VSYLPTGEVVAELERSVIDKTNSGFLSTIDERIRGKGSFVASVEGNKTDPRTMFRFRSPAEVPMLWGIVAAAGLLGFVVGRMRK
jgi:hypothetical protein